MKKKTRQEFYEELRRAKAIRWTQILNALKYRGMEGMKRKMVELIIQK